ncbi:hypothetical protein GUJ93_ZPchr0012g19230 [Zizania palustris]|uniref:t-SNARE coiled-coil homology domain-containing protein n=1 Tax=Zizania palustris TaxID=103762 RepID=A0A8J5WM76_ZIZPA|nr:hypothetical protein GUJ93_ZPchr0012g19230 [Zizania palustris]
MATRNRTPLYRKYRDALRHVRAPAGAPSSSSSSGGGPVIEMASLLRSDRPYAALSTDDPSTASSRGAATVGLPPAWVDVSEEISANMQRARTKMAELAKAHAKALMPSFGDGRDDQRAIEILTHEVTDLLKRSEKRLQKLSMKDSSEDSNVRKNVQRSLATDLQNLSMEFRKKQSTYLKQLRQQKEGQDGVDLEMNINGSKSTFELGDDEFEDMGFTEVQMSKLKKSEAFTREREREIEQAVESVNELAQIMKDLSVLVIDQGTIIDRIDYNIQNVAASVEEGYRQLQKAERTQKKGGMVMCATVLVILIFIMICLHTGTAAVQLHGYSLLISKLKRWPQGWFACVALSVTLAVVRAAGKLEGFVWLLEVAAKNQKGSMDPLLDTIIHSSNLFHYSGGEDGRQSSAGIG